MRLKEIFKKALPAKTGGGRFTKPISADYLREIFADCGDFTMRPVAVGGADGRRAQLCFIDGLTSGKDIAEMVLMPLTDDDRMAAAKTDMEAAELMLNGLVFGHTVKKRDRTDDVVDDILSGFCAVVFRGLAVTFEARSPDKRAITEPKEEKVIKGAKDSFVEVMRANTMMLRRHMRTPDLKIRELIVGRRTKTRVAVAYVKGVVDPGLVERVVQRISEIDTDGLVSTAALEEHIADTPRSPFPQLMQTERPDRFCMNLLEGRVGILIDGLPICFLAPGTFTQFFKVAEDRASHYVAASLLILLRYAAFVVSLVLPAVFVAVAMYHQEMLPTKLIESMIDAKQSVPFPVAVEVITMLISFELLQEAGMRLPNPIGVTVSIIGALIVGQSAVEAKVVSPIAVIVVALAGITGYTMADQDLSNALRLCRFLLLLAAIGAGMFGIALGIGLLIYHLCSLESFGVPYMTPMVGKYGGVGLWQMLRPPLWAKKSRERALETEDESL